MPADPATSRLSPEIKAAFKGDWTPPARSPAYAISLIVVAAMVLLIPLAYVGVIALAAPKAPAQAKA